MKKTNIKISTEELVKEVEQENLEELKIAFKKELRIALYEKDRLSKNVKINQQRIDCLKKAWNEGTYRSTAIVIDNGYILGTVCPDLHPSKWTYTSGTKDNDYIGSIGTGIKREKEK